MLSLATEAAVVVVVIFPIFVLASDFVNDFSCHSDHLKDIPILLSLRLLLQQLQSCAASSGIESGNVFHLSVDISLSHLFQIQALIGTSRSCETKCNQC